MDTVDKSTRSKIMSSVAQKNTGPEVKLRKVLYRSGLRYRIHDKNLPGSPDIVFPRFKAVLFVHGCFWHRHGCKATTTPKDNYEYWEKKFFDNIERDKRFVEALRQTSWRVAIVWECDLKGKKSDPEKIATIVKRWLYSDIPFVDDIGASILFLSDHE